MMIGAEWMKNRKLMFFNIVIFFMILSIVFIGKRTWSTNHEQLNQAVVADEQIDKDEKKERPEVHTPEIAKLDYANFSKKKKKDFELFAKEELEIIELEMGERSEERRVGKECRTGWARCE